jgi:hypothetical protein
MPWRRKEPGRLDRVGKEKKRKAGSAGVLAQKHNKAFFLFFKTFLSFQTPLNQFKSDSNLNGFNSILKPRTLNQLNNNNAGSMKMQQTNFINPKLI